MAARITTAFAGFDRTRMERDLPLQDGGKELGVATPKMVILAVPTSGTAARWRSMPWEISPDKYSRYILPIGKACGNDCELPDRQPDRTDRSGCPTRFRRWPGAQASRLRSPRRRAPCVGAPLTPVRRDPA
jgi:hypothetical protein